MESLVGACSGSSRLRVELAVRTGAFFPLELGEFQECDHESYLHTQWLDGYVKLGATCARYIRLEYAQPQVNADPSYPFISMVNIKEM